jgi:hypothetical protein
VVSMTKTEMCERLGNVADELTDLRASLEFPVGAHLPITPSVLERLGSACVEIRSVAGIDDTPVEGAHDTEEPTAAELDDEALKAT